LLAAHEVLALEKEAKAAAEIGRLDKAVTAAADAKMHSEPLTNINFMVSQWVILLLKSKSRLDPYQQDLNIL